MIITAAIVDEEGRPFSIRQVKVGGSGLQSMDDVDAIDQAVHDRESGAVIEPVHRMA